MGMGVKFVVAVTLATLLTGCYENQICESNDGVFWQHLNDQSKRFIIKNLETGVSSENVFKIEADRFSFEPAAGQVAAVDPMLADNAGKTCEINGSLYVEYAMGVLYQLERAQEITDREVYRVHGVGVDPVIAESLGIASGTFPSPVPGGPGYSVYKNPADNPRLIVPALVPSVNIQYEIEIF